MATPVRPPLRSMAHTEYGINKPKESAGAAITHPAPKSATKSFLTPKKKAAKRSGSKIMSSLKKKGGKLRRALTPPRGINVGCAKTPGRPNTPAPLTFSPKFRNAHNYQIKSNEHDPTKFQVEVPSHEEILASAKICAVMDNYVELCGVDFDFSSLMPFGGASPDINALLLGGNMSADSDNSSNPEVHPIHSKLQAAVSDIVVEGFYREHADEEIGRVEVLILSSEASRQIYVVYRGSSKLQDRPLHAIKAKNKTVVTESVENESEGDGTEDKTSDKRDDENAVEVEIASLDKIIKHKINETVSKAYANSNLEESIFTLLNRLIGFKPFNDVTVIGHSFGGTLATIAASKYASQKQASRIRCHVFGSPQIGGFDFRNEVHSLPNLSMIRVERSTDPFVSVPVSESVPIGSGKPMEWTHVGHCLKINPTQALSPFPIPDDVRPVDIRLYRFDKLRPLTTFVTSSVTSVCNFSKLKIGNEIRSYVKDLEKVTSLKLTWPDTFAGQVSGRQISTGYLA